MEIREISDKKLQGKMERIQHLDRLGFNVPDYTLATSVDDLDYIKRDLFPKYERMSLRTYSKVDEFKEFVCPHYPNWETVELEKMIDELVGKYYVMISPPVDPGQCRFAGNIITPKTWDDHLIMEYAKGPNVTVRSVEKQGRRLELSRRGDVIIDEKMEEDVAKLRDQVLRFPTENMIIEWGIYTEPVGKHSDELLYWEYRSTTY